MADKLRCVSHPLMDAQHAVLHIYLWQNQLEHIIERILVIYLTFWFISFVINVWLYDLTGFVLNPDQLYIQTVFVKKVLCPKIVRNIDSK